MSCYHILLGFSNHLELELSWELGHTSHLLPMCHALIFSCVGFYQGHALFLIKIMKKLCDFTLHAFFYFHDLKLTLSACFQFLNVFILGNLDPRLAIHEFMLCSFLASVRFYCDS